MAAVVPRVTLADPVANAKDITEVFARLESAGVDLAVFPELSVTGYSCGDLFHSSLLLDAAGKALSEIAAATAGHRGMSSAGWQRVVQLRCGGCRGEDSGGGA